MATPLPPDLLLMHPLPESTFTLFTDVNEVKESSEYAFFTVHVAVAIG